ncbi:MAG TPA: acyl-CoA dehydrogenase family protein [Steroidobacteraceae bacterium]|nr:acyl-CoA dehydrogenase family protein [Steroidobacteraceae bacterium]
MRLHPLEGEIEFRAEVRQFLASAPSEMEIGKPFGHVHSRATRELWTKALAERGWLVPHWPAEWGGQSWPSTLHYILAQELCSHRCPEIEKIGTELVGPILLSFGCEEQRRRFLPPILSGEEFWCQGFSEAGAGSDLSQIRTTARKQGDSYRVNGHKLWTTQAHEADLMLALVRVANGDSLQQGHTFLMIPMKTPGVQVRPIITLDGGHSINEVMLDDVRVPIDSRVGEEGHGWTYARAVLSAERMGAAGIPHTQRDLLFLQDLARQVRRRGRLLANDPHFRQRLAQLNSEVLALEFLLLRILQAPPSAERDALGCVLKLRGAEAYQRVSELMLDAVGARAMVRQLEDSVDDSVTAAYLFRRSATIAGGTSEIQRNIIAALGLQL